MRTRGATTTVNGCIRQRQINGLDILAVPNPRKDMSSTRLLAGILMLAASPASIALAQTSSTLPPVVVEGQKAKKKKAAAPVKQAPPPAPAPVVAQPPQDPPGSYKVERASSPKMTGPLLDTPQTISVIPGTIIQERGNTNLTDVLKNTPGISFNAGENAFTSSTNNFAIRGFDASGSIFIDGVRDSGSYARDMYNVVRVEIVKGAAADNGRGTAGGYVNIVTKTPTLDNFVAGDLSIGFDQYNSEIRKRATIDMNQRSGTTAVRLNGMIEDGGVAGREIAEANSWGLAPSITFGLGTRFRTTLAYEHYERHDLPDWGVPQHILPGMFRSDPSVFGVPRDNFYGLRSDFDDVRGDSLLARVEYDVAPGVTVSNQTRWSQTDRFARFVFPNGYAPATQLVTTNLQFYDRVNESLSNQTNLTGTYVVGGLKHIVSTGVEVTRESSDANRLSLPNGAGGPTDIFNPNPNRINPPPYDPAQRSSININTVAAYIYDTIHLSRQWQLVGGVRLEHYNVDIASKDLPGNTAAGLDGFSASETTLGGKIGVLYKPAPNGTLYASYGTSVLPPGSYLSNPDISREDENSFPGFVAGADPVRMHNYEVGVKWDWFGGRLSTSAALFRTDKVGVPTTGCNAPTPPTCPTGPVDETRVVEGDQIVQGVELGVAGNLTDRWKVFGGMAIIDSERRHSAEYDRVRRNANPGDYGAVVRTDGHELAFTPNFMATLWTTYALTERFTIGGGVQYVSESWVGRPDDAARVIPNGNAGKLPDYFIVNLMASYALTDNIDLRFNADNVLDETYAVSTNWSNQRVLLGAPRTFRIGTAFKY